MKATEFGMVTLVGYMGPFPRDDGNCFSLVVEPAREGESLDEALDRRQRRVVNMHHENLLELLRNGANGLAWPIEVEELGPKHCAIVDERVPRAWLLEQPCSICTPPALLEAAARYTRGNG